MLYLFCFAVQKHTEPPVSLHGQVLWREFFYTVGAGTPNFNKMVGNSACIQIDWDTNEDFLEAWKYVSLICKHVEVDWHGG